MFFSFFHWLQRVCTRAYPPLPPFLQFWKYWWQHLSELHRRAVHMIMKHHERKASLYLLISRLMLWFLFVFIWTVVLACNQTVVRGYEYLLAINWILLLCLLLIIIFGGIEVCVISTEFAACFNLKFDCIIYYRIRISMIRTALWIVRVWSCFCPFVLSSINKFQFWYKLVALSSFEICDRRESVA